MLKARVVMLEKRVSEVVGNACTACYSTDGRWGWVPLFRSNADVEKPYGADERCIRCGAEPRTVVDIVTSACAAEEG